MSILDYLFGYFRLSKDDTTDLTGLRLKIFSKLHEIAWHTTGYYFAILEIPDVMNRFIWKEFDLEDRGLFSLTSTMYVYGFKGAESVTIRFRDEQRQITGLGVYYLPSTIEQENIVTVTYYDTMSLAITRMHSLWFHLYSKTINDWYGYMGSGFKGTLYSNKILGNLILLQTTPDLRYITGAIQLIGIRPINDPLPLAVLGQIDNYEIREVQIQYAVTHIRKLLTDERQLWSKLLKLYFEPVSPEYKAKFDKLAMLNEQMPPTTVNAILNDYDLGLEATMTAIKPELVQQEVISSYVNQNQQSLQINPYQQKLYMAGCGKCPGKRVTARQPDDFLYGEAAITAYLRSKGGPYRTAAEIVGERSRAYCENWQQRVFLAKPLIDILIDLRVKFGAIVTGTWRCHESNEKIGGVKNSPHLRGIAADIGVVGRARQEQIAAYLAQTYCLGRFGFYDRHFHFDLWEGCAEWTGKSK